jgi:hypothetical protein
MNIVYLWLIIFSVIDDVFINSEAFLVIDFVNLKIKSAQFKDAHRSRVCVFIGGVIINV